jgi:hypothetical protein
MLTDYEPTAKRKCNRLLEGQGIPDRVCDRVHRGPNVDFPNYVCSSCEDHYSRVDDEADTDYDESTQPLHLFGPGEPYESRGPPLLMDKDRSKR